MPKWIRKHLEFVIMHRGQECTTAHEGVQGDTSPCSSLKLLSWVAQVSMEQGAIQPKQFQQISEQCWNTQNLLGAWIISDQKRLNSGKQKQEPSDQGSAPE